MLSIGPMVTPRMPPSPLFAQASAPDPSSAARAAAAGVRVSAKPAAQKNLCKKPLWAVAGELVCVPRDSNPVRAAVAGLASGWQEDPITSLGDALVLRPTEVNLRAWVARLSHLAGV